MEDLGMRILFGGFCLEDLSWRRDLDMRILYEGLDMRILL